VVRIELSPRFRREVRRHRDLKPIEAALRSVQDGFGQAHRHSGLGIRHLQRHWFECRVGLNTRLVFWAEKEVLTFHLAGNHDDVRRFLKGV